MRVVLFAQKPIGEKCFNYLLKSTDGKINLAGVSSNKNVQNTWWKTTTIANQCRKHSIPFLPSEEADENQTKQFISGCKADLLISIQHPKLISEEAIALVKGRAFNLHLAALPNYKGYYGINHAILNQDKIYKTTIHWMVKNIDEGDIAYESSIPISPKETALSLYNKAANLGFSLFVSLINDLTHGITPPKKPQNKGGFFYNRNSLSKLKKIDFPIDPKELDIKTRAFHFPPFEPAYIMINGIKIGLVYIEENSN